MKTSEFTKLINGTPYYVAVFTLAKVPDWLLHYDMAPKVRDQLYWNNGQVTVPGGGSWNIGCTYLKWDGYYLAERTGPWGKTKLLEKLDV